MPAAGKHTCVGYFESCTPRVSGYVDNAVQNHRRLT